MDFDPLYRYQVARLLTEHGIDPTNMTSNQFRNFALQDPDTQSKSIDLYKKNMAEYKGHAKEAAIGDTLSEPVISLHPKVQIDPTISRDNTAGLKAEQDGDLAAVFKRHELDDESVVIHIPRPRVPQPPSVREVREPLIDTSKHVPLQRLRERGKSTRAIRSSVVFDNDRLIGPSLARKFEDPVTQSDNDPGLKDQLEVSSAQFDTENDWTDAAAATVAEMQRAIDQQQRDLELVANRLGFVLPPKARVDADQEHRAGSQVDLSSSVARPLEELYAVLCSKSSAHCLFFRDQPVLWNLPWSETNDGQGDGTVDQFDRSIARGRLLIGTDLQQYLQHHSSLEMVALWLVQCPEVLEPCGMKSKFQDSAGSELKLSMQLSILVVSPALRNRISESSKFPLPGSEALPFVEDYDELHFPDHIGVINQDGFYYQHRDMLRALTDDAAASMWSSALASALDLAGPHWDARCQEAQELHSGGYAARWSLPFLFHPNQAVVARPPETKNEPAVYVVLEVTPHLLSCWIWDFDGQRFYRSNTNLTLGLQDEGPTRITEMDVYPLEFASPQMISDLTDRGKAMWSLREQRFVCYTGWDANNDNSYNDTRFIVDVATHRRIHEKPANMFSKPPRSNHVSRLPHEIGIGEPMPEGIALLAMPPLVAGFNLQSKKWISLRVKNIKPIHFNKSAFSSLVLPKDTKELVHALVATQEGQDGPHSHNDMIAGKGNGLILLLHGGPGTGKTLTAESVAEIAEKPLYRVTCGDIGTDPNSVEKYLNAVLYLGKTWNCVVLLDEADVFLEERDLFDLARNSLVSVFLRTLEYYEGILILTSNRVGTFDEAFASRIQVALHYPDLTRVTRKKIWQNFLDRIEEDESLPADVAEIADHIDELKELEMNGRQIRNAVNTARRLATFKKEKLAWAHVKQVVGIVGQFTEYLEKTHDSLKARDRARHAQLRH